MSNNNTSLRKTDSDEGGDFSARNRPSSRNATVKGVSQRKIDTIAESSSRVIGSDNEQSATVCRSQEYFCEMCGFYPLTPVHGHFECPQCRYKTKCCEGAPL